MIKKSISQIVKICNEALEDVDKTDYYKGSKEVAGNVYTALEDVTALYSIYYELDGEWIELAVTQYVTFVHHLADGFAKQYPHNKIRYEFSGNKVFEVVMVGNDTRHFLVTSV